MFPPTHTPVLSSALAVISCSTGTPTSSRPYAPGSPQTHTVVSRPFSTSGFSVFIVPATLSLMLPRAALTTRLSCRSFRSSTRERYMFGSASIGICSATFLDVSRTTIQLISPSTSSGRFLASYPNTTPRPPQRCAQSRLPCSSSTTSPPSTPGLCPTNYHQRPSPVPTTTNAHGPRMCDRLPRTAHLPPPIRPHIPSRGTRRAPCNSVPPSATRRRKRGSSLSAPCTMPPVATLLPPTSQR